jgi:hypothetical protein
LLAKLSSELFIGCFFLLVLLSSIDLFGIVANRTSFNYAKASRSSLTHKVRVLWRQRGGWLELIVNNLLSNLALIERSHGGLLLFETHRLHLSGIALNSLVAKGITHED